MNQSITRGNKIRNILLCTLIISQVAKVYVEQEVFSKDENTRHHTILLYLGVKIITGTLITIRLLVLIFLLYIFGSCVWYFTKAKSSQMRARGDYGLSKLNYAIISCIYLLITLRLLMYITINILTVDLIILFDESKAHNDPQPTLWILFRGIIGPIIYIIELMMISYMVYH